MAETLLDNEFLARLEYLYVVTREQFLGHVSAERLSKKFGVGLEFADYRSYVAGDDYRYLDWSAFARRGDLLIKLFTEEQAAHLYFVIDASRSMATGQPEKLHYAKKIAAALGYVGLSNLDPVTMVVFDGKLRDAVRTFQGRGQLQQMLRYLESVREGGDTTAMGPAIGRFVQRFAGTHGVVIMVSDFLDRPGYEEALRLLHYHRFDLVAIQVNDRSEVDPPSTGDLELVDSESGERVSILTTPALLASYHAARTAHYAELARLCKVLRRMYLPVVTDTPFESLVFEVFRGGLLR